MTTRHVQLGDLRVAYDDVGDGSAGTLVLLHGFPHSRALWAAQLVGIPARATTVAGGAAPAPSFLPYGTACSEHFDPVTQKTELLRCEVEQLRRRLDALIDEQRQERDRA